MESSRRLLEEMLYEVLGIAVGRWYDHSTSIELSVNSPSTVATQPQRRQTLPQGKGSPVGGEQEVWLPLSCLPSCLGEGTTAPQGSAGKGTRATGSVRITMRMQNESGSFSEGGCGKISRLSPGCGSFHGPTSPPPSLTRTPRRTPFYDFLKLPFCNAFSH